MRAASRPEHGLQHQRRAGRRVDGRVRAHEEQAQPLVGHGGAFGARGLVHFAGQQQQGLRGLVLHAGVAPGVQLAVPRHAQQPRIGLRGNAVGRPAFERAREGVGERVFGGGDVVRARRQNRQQPAVRLARRPFGGLMSRRVVHDVACGGREDGPHFHAPADGAGRARRPFECGVQVRHVHHEVAAELLLGVGEGAVLHLALVAAHAQRGAGHGREEAVAAERDARLAHRIGIRDPAGPVGLRGRVVALFEFGRGLIEHQHVLHGVSP
jgi:hypothetical protein